MWNAKQDVAPAACSCELCWRDLDELGELTREPARNRPMPERQREALLAAQESQFAVTY